MIFTSYIPALDMLIISLDPLSKPVGPIIVNDRILGVPLFRYRSRGSGCPGYTVAYSIPHACAKAYRHKGSKDTSKTLSLPSLL